jgi:CubicO group peptidase (beta-lactamase class C family)
VAGINKKELEGFFDGIVPELMLQKHVPGAVVAVAKDGKTLFAKGFGYANLEEKVPVDPDKSLFRIGSVTKLFTWTAVMQLVEAGKLELDADINQYLSEFQIPNAYGEPITLNHLMSHTAGFEDRGLIGTLAHSPTDMMSLEQYLAGNMPARVRPPGQISAYSNYGGALAGYIVAKASGLSYERYVQEKIFAPLEMNQATAAQTTPGENMASGYVRQEGTYRPVPYAYLIPVPEGGISASANSMARFMIAHLEGGRFRGRAILGQDTVVQMHRQSFTHHPRLAGWAHGFEEDTINGYRLLQQGGYLNNFSSLLVLVPSQRLGLFVSFNSRGGSSAGRELKKQFFDKFLPNATPAAAPVKSVAVANLEHYDGFYAPCRSAKTTMAKLGTLVQASRAKVDGENEISFLGQTWRPQAPDLFRSEDGEDLLAVQKDQNGTGTYLFVGTSAWRRLPWYQAPVFQLALLGSCLTLFLFTFVAWPLGYLRDRSARGHIASKSWISKVARCAAWVASIINLGFVAALAIILSGDTSALEFGVPLHLRLLLALPIVSTILALAVIVFSFVSLKAKWWSRFGTFHYCCVALASIAFVWFLGFWNLLGWHF